LFSFFFHFHLVFFPSSFVRTPLFPLFFSCPFVFFPFLSFANICLLFLLIFYPFFKKNPCLFFYCYFMSSPPCPFEWLKKSSVAIGRATEVFWLPKVGDWIFWSPWGRATENVFNRHEVQWPNFFNCHNIYNDQNKSNFSHPISMF
jgi:hypothetical protein